MAGGRGRGRPRRVGTSTANEDSIAIDISIPPVDANSNNVEGVNVEAAGELESSGSKHEKKTAEASKSPARRSSRIEGRKASNVHFSLVQGEKAASGPQVNSLPSPVQEVPLEPSPNNIEISNDETIQSLKVQIKKNSQRNKRKQEAAAQRKKAVEDPNAGTVPKSTEINSEKEAPSRPNSKNLETGPSEEKTLGSIRRSGRNKRTAEASVPSSPAEKKKKASKQQKAIAPQSSKEEVPVQGPNVVQAENERNLDNTGPDGSLTPHDSYQSNHKAAQKKMEELMAGNIELANQLHFERGKVEAYEKMMSVVMPLRCLPPTAAVATDPPAAVATDPPVVSPPVATGVAPVTHEASPSTKKKRKYTKKQDAPAA